jgi:hypothetical protein
MGERRPGRDQERRLTMAEAAEVLGTTKDAVRMRVRRGSLRSELGEDGKRYVYVDSDRDAVRPEGEGEGFANPLIEAKDETIEVLREQLRAEREAHAEARRIIAALTQRIPELEAPASPEASRSPQEGSEEPAEEHRSDPDRRTWWRRIFGE